MFVVDDDALDLESGAELKVLEHEDVRRIRERDHELSAGDLEGQDAERTTRPGVDLVERGSSRLDARQIDVPETGLHRQRLRHRRIIDVPELDQHLADAAALLALVSQRLLDLTLVDQTQLLQNLPEKLASCQPQPPPTLASSAFGSKARSSIVSLRIRPER